jgi:hypothetical protein
MRTPVLTDIKVLGPLAPVPRRGKIGLSTSQVAKQEDTS